MRNIEVSEEEYSELVKRRDEQFIESRKKALCTQIEQLQEEFKNLSKESNNTDSYYRYPPNPWTGPSADDV